LKLLENEIKKPVLNFFFIKNAITISEEIEENSLKINLVLSSMNFISIQLIVKMNLNGVLFLVFMVLEILAADNNNGEFIGTLWIFIVTLDPSRLLGPRKRFHNSRNR
jgi:hypothetical protein